MATFPYMANPASLKKFMEHVQKAGVPEKVTQTYLESVGFKGKNDRPIITVLKFIGFVDNAGTPTELWSRYRNKQEAPKVLALALRTGYADLFNTYPDADRKDNEALRDYFSTHTSVGEGALTYIVRTFKTLCEMADFEAPVSADISPEQATPAAPRPAAAVRASPPTGTTVNINVQLQLPATEDASVYEKLFAAMKKHLF